MTPDREALAEEAVANALRPIWTRREESCEHGDAGVPCFECSVVAVADALLSGPLASAPPPGDGGLPAWRTEELPPLPADVKSHAVGYGLALRHDLTCPMRKVIYENHGDPCTCGESERRCERSAQMAYAAGLAARPYPPPGDGRTWLPLAAILTLWRVGSGEWSWREEFDKLAERSYLDMLTTSIQETGIQEPVSLGGDGRVWDGHHRLAVADRIGLTSVPVEFMPVEPPAPPPPGDEGEAVEALREWLSWTEGYVAQVRPDLPDADGWQVTPYGVSGRLPEFIVAHLRTLLAAVERLTAERDAARDLASNAQGEDGPQ